MLAWAFLPPATRLPDDSVPANRPARHAGADAGRMPGRDDLSEVALGRNSHFGMGLFLPITDA